MSNIHVSKELDHSKSPRVRLGVGLARGQNPNLVEGQFGMMPGTMKEHSMSMQSIFTGRYSYISCQVQCSTSRTDPGGIGLFAKKAHGTPLTIGPGPRCIFMFFEGAKPPSQYGADVGIPLILAAWHLKFVGSKYTMSCLNVTSSMKRYFPFLIARLTD